jgi:fructokinase
VTDTQQRVLIGTVEAGGTKFVCAVVESPVRVLERVVVPTADPGSTFGACLRFFHAAAGRHGRLAAAGVASFGPLQLHRDAPDYGCLMSTPKPGWSGVNVLEQFRVALGVPVALATDVGAAAMGELRLGTSKGQGSLAYVTVGTGIGGAIAPDLPDTRAMHAEMGHLIVRRDSRDADFAGVCPFHRDCLEGLASGPAIEARWGCKLSSLPAGHPGRSIIASYLGQLVSAIALLHAPQRLVIGGGVLADGLLLPLVRDWTRTWLGGYLPHLADAQHLDNFIQSPFLGGDSAISGAALMAFEAYQLKGAQSR